MRSTQLLAATVALGALGLSALVCPAANAQGTVVQTNPMTGKPAIIITPMASPKDRYQASWIYANLDAGAVRRYQAMGLSDWTTKAAANIAMRAGLDMDYVIRLHRESGMTMYDIASKFGVNTRYVDMDIPGYGAGELLMPYHGTMMGSAASMEMLAPVAQTTTTTTSETTATATDASYSSTPPATAAIAQGSVVDAIANNPDLSTLCTAIKAAGLTETLAGPGPFTIFAPSNAAFAKLPPGTVDDWMKPENQDKLRAALCYHVVPGKVMAADVLAMANPSTPKTVNGATLTVKTTAPVMVNDATVTQTDIVASNGVIHVIDTVLTPPTTSPVAPAL